VDQQQQPRWWPTRRKLLWAAGIVLALAFLISLYGGYRYGWKWTGLVKDADFHKRTLWDWLGLLIVPAVLALGGYLFTRSETRRTQDIAEQQRALDQELADQRTHEDRKIADERRQDDMLQAYLNQIGQLLLDKDRPLRQSKEGDEVQTLARAQTLTVLPRLDDGRKRSVLQFLYESDLITKDGVIVNLKGTDLSGADLSGADLREAKVTDEQLDQAAHLQNTTMPNGQKYEDWLKSKGCREDGENGGLS
jgi:hypothetical protein